MLVQTNCSVDERRNVHRVYGAFAVFYIPNFLLSDCTYDYSYDYFYNDIYDCFCDYVYSHAFDCFDDQDLLRHLYRLCNNVVSKD
jgi:hypothetical protein